MSIRRRCVVAGMMLTTAGLGVVQADLAHLATRVPDTANAIMLVNVREVMASPMAKSGNWEEERQKARGAGVTAAPPTADWFMMAAELDYEFMHPLWEVAAAYMPQRLTMEEVAKISGGRLDSLAGAKAVERPNDSYVVAFGPRFVGAMSPANRKNVMRWVRESRSKKAPDLSPYLAAALAAADDDVNHIVLAFDLENVLAPDEMKAGLKDSKALADSGVDQESAARIMAGIRGARLEIEIQEEAGARFRVDFDKNPASLAPAAKGLLMEVLSEHGVRVESPGQWATSIEPKSIMFEGQMSPSGLRRVFSLLDGPVGPWSAPPESGADYTPGDQPGAEATRRYFQQVIEYLNDLFIDNRAQPQSWYQVRVWVERYARQIEDLDRTGVDPDAVGFADDVAMRLREIVHVVQQAEGTANAREAMVGVGGGRGRYVRYGPYAFYEKPYAVRDRAVIQADEGIKAMRNTDVIVEDIRAISAQTRQLLTGRYGGKF